MDIKILQCKLENTYFIDLGITSSDLVKIIHCHPRFLNCRINLWLNERLEYFRALFGSNEVLLKAIVRNPSLFTYDFHNKIKPVVAIYEKLGVSRRDLIPMLLSFPTLIPRSTLDNEKLDYISRTRVSKEIFNLVSREMISCSLGARDPCPPIEVSAGGQGFLVPKGQEIIFFGF
ncbi:uncharacterized protein Fot_50713 [Forsythia ovata]|uniref:Uncharacterized protein n=1 Tax=Forsythia ovata TaxID=205694 RepID=A0ABD1PYZ3_9LAMI